MSRVNDFGTKFHELKGWNGDRYVLSVDARVELATLFDEMTAAEKRVTREEVRAWGERDPQVHQTTLDLLEGELPEPSHCTCVGGA